MINTKEKFAGIEEAPEVGAKLAKLNAAGKWPDEPKPEPTMEEVDQQLVENAKVMKSHGMYDTTYALEILTAPDACTDGMIVNFARFTWQNMSEGALIYIPHGATRKQAVDWLEAAQRFIVNYWGGILLDPQQMSCMVYEGKAAGWEEDQKRKPKAVKDDDVSTWPVERYKAAQEAAENLGLIHLLKAPAEQRDAFVNHFLKNVPENAREVITWLASYRKWLDRETAKLRKKKGGRDGKR
jgi:hypothetical protein